MDLKRYTTRMKEMHISKKYSKINSRKTKERTVLSDIEALTNFK